MTYRKICHYTTSLSGYVLLSTSVTIIVGDGGIMSRGLSLIFDRMRMRGTRVSRSSAELTAGFAPLSLVPWSRS